MSAHLYIEGAESKEQQIRCREGFRKLLEKAGLATRMPRLSACGGRESTFDDFKVAHGKCKEGHYVAMLVDSEDPVSDIEKTWRHLKTRDNWDRPTDARDEQVLLMTTCMETWIAADRGALQEHYGNKLQVSALPPVENLEGRSRHDMHDKLEHATRNCTNAYAKGARSYEVIKKLDPKVLKQHLPSFERVERILKMEL